MEAKAGLVSPGNGWYEYQSGGGVTIKIQQHVDFEGLRITLTDVSYPNHIEYEIWGISESGEHSAMHENLNGKHIKDRIGDNRTVFFPDGTKITCVAAGPNKSVTAISIYDGANAHHLNITCNTIEYSASNAAVAKRLDELQPDGETSTYELTDTGLMFYNIYTEDMPGNKVEQRVNLGALFNDNPNNVRDFYDDPRLDHT
ncbi:MAG TPA: hypothetical protein PLR74_11805 [Agriterribacter sp.]|nr:hypothetical protein [Agriterribacter sp.]